MSKKKLILPAILFLFAAVISRVSTPYRAINVFFDTVGDLVIISLCIGWYIDISKHITNKHVGLYLKTVCGLCIFWISAKTFRWSLYQSGVLSEYLWYAYYIPVVLLPLFSLYISLYTGKLPDYRPQKKFKLLYIPAFALIILVLTNGFHNLVFKFSTDRRNDMYSYNIGHNLIVIWTFALIFAFLAILYKNSKIPESKRRIYIPFISVIFISVYCIFYPFLKNTFFYKSFNLSYAAIIFVYYIFNACCYVGLISYNGNYDLIFRNSSVNAFITDEGYNVVYKSGANSEHCTDIKNMQTDSENFILKQSKINSGYVFWTEDITEINEYIEELNETKDLLKQENEILKADFEIKSQNEKIKKKIELYNEINNAVASQINGINTLTQSGVYNNKTLADICILCAFIKRKSNLLLLNESSQELSLNELSLSIKESLNYAKLYNIEYAVNIKTEKTVPGKLLINAYDRFEAVLENRIKEMSYIYVVLSGTENGFSFNIITENSQGVTDNKNMRFAVESETV